MERKTELLVEADIQIWLGRTEGLQVITVRDIPCVWEWDNGSRFAAEYWAVYDLSRDAPLSNPYNYGDDLENEFVTEPYQPSRS